MEKEGSSKVMSDKVYGLGQLNTWESYPVGGDSSRKRNSAKEAMGDQSFGGPSGQKSGKGQATGS